MKRKLGDNDKRKEKKRNEKYLAIREKKSYEKI